MRVVRWLSAALLAVATFVVPVAAHAAPAVHNAITINAAASTDPDRPGGQTGAYEQQGDRIAANWFSTGGIFLDGDYTDDDRHVSAIIDPGQADGQQLSVGTFRLDYTDWTADRLSLTVGHSGCSANSGTLVISELSGTGDTGVLTADYDVMCAFNHMTGSIRFNSTAGFRAVDIAPGGTRLGNLDIGETRDLTYSVASHGTSHPTLGAVSFVTTAAANTYSVGADTCTGTTLADDVTCSVTVHVRVLAAGDQNATVRFGHDNADPYEVAILLTGVDPVTGTYYPVDPQRVVETRTGIGAPRRPLGAGQAFNFYPRGANNGQKASAVVLNLTVTSPSTSGYLTLYPSGTARPRTSSINYTRAWTGANLVTVPVDAFGRVAVYNSAGAVAVIADIVGWYAAPSDDTVQPRGGGYHPTLVQRIFDTRTAGFGKLKGGYYVEIPVRYQNDGKHIGALSVTVTAANMTGTGYLTSWNGYYDAPGTSTLNYTKASGVVSNAAVVPTSYCPPSEACNANAYIAVQNQGATPVDVIVDISGYYDDGNLPADVRFRALPSPTRIIDTRSNLGTGRFGANATHTVKAPTSVAGIDTIALDANITAVVPTQRTYLTVWPKYDDYPRPQAAVLNPLQGQTVADHVVAEVGYGNLFDIYNFTGATDVTMDVGGTFELFPPTPPGATKRATPHAVASPTGNLATTGPVLHRG